MVEPIEDRDSYLLRSMYPTGTARGWRRTGCLALLGGALIAVVSTLVAVIVFGPDEELDRVEEPCDLLAIQLTYLEGQDAGSAEVAAELARVRRRIAEQRC